MCAVGWEPNPAHTPVLVKLEEAYNRCGWKVKTIQLCAVANTQCVNLMLQVKIHTETGVGARRRETHFKNIDYAKKGDGQS